MVRFLKTLSLSSQHKATGAFPCVPVVYSKLAFSFLVAVVPCGFPNYEDYSYCAIDTSMSCEAVLWGALLNLS